MKIAITINRGLSKEEAKHVLYEAYESINQAIDEDNLKDLANGVIKNEQGAVEGIIQSWE
jgi:hypothetical protein